MSARDVILIGVLIFTFGMAFFIVHYASNTIIDDLLLEPEVNKSSDAVSAFGGTKSATDRFDYVVFGLFVGLMLSLVITSYFVSGHPLFMFAYFIVIILGVILGAGLANVWGNATQMSVFGATIDSFPLTNHIISKLPVYISVIGFIGIVIMFAKPQRF